MNADSLDQPEIKKHFWIYALKLEQGKYYIGITTKKDPYNRINTHGGFYGAKWTRKYKPVETLELYELGILTQQGAEKKENELAQKYIEKFGIKNVRGGDLNYSGKYIHRFGRYFIEKDWEVITVITLLLVAILALLLTR